MLQRRNHAPTEVSPPVPLEDLAQRQAFVLRKLEQDGYPCEVQAARRVLRRTQKLLALRRRGGRPTR